MTASAGKAACDGCLAETGLAHDNNNVLSLQGVHIEGRQQPAGTFLKPVAAHA